MARFGKTEKEVKMETVDEVQTQVETVEEKAPEVKMEMKIDVKSKIDTPVVNVSEAKSVKIKPNFTGKKFVGNAWYNFVKDEVIVVPKQVKDLLVEQNGIIAQ